MAQERAPGDNDRAQNLHCLFKPQWLGFQGLQWLEQEETTGSILILVSNFSNTGFDDYAGFYGSFSSKMSGWTQVRPLVGLGSRSLCGAESQPRRQQALLVNFVPPCWPVGFSHSRAAPFTPSHTASFLCPASSQPSSVPTSCLPMAATTTSFIPQESGF